MGCAWFVRDNLAVRRGCAWQRSERLPFGDHPVNCPFADTVACVRGARGDIRSSVHANNPGVRARNNHIQRRVRTHNGDRSRRHVCQRSERGRSFRRGQCACGRKSCQRTGAYTFTAGAPKEQKVTVRSSIQQASRWWVGIRRSQRSERPVRPNAVGVRATTTSEEVAIYVRK